MWFASDAYGAGARREVSALATAVLWSTRLLGGGRRPWRADTSLHTPAVRTRLRVGGVGVTNGAYATTVLTRLDASTSRHGADGACGVAGTYGAAWHSPSPTTNPHAS